VLREAKRLTVTAAQVNITGSTVGTNILYYGVLKRWDGAAWQEASIKSYNGATFVPRLLRRYDGTAWRRVRQA
jgi:hypothetical protein